MSSLKAVISNTDELNAACERLRAYPYIAVDTEFIRETTYYPRLCLVQIASSDEAVAIDPLAATIDLAPLFALLADKSITKVFHAGRQDLEIFLHLTGRLPRAVYDTQIAAMVCGFDEQVGYSKLVEDTLKISLDKSSRFTDWSSRPLTEKQLAYALDDVIYLERLYPLLTDTIAQNGREEWLTEEMDKIYDQSAYQVNPAEAWRKIRHRNGKPIVLNRLKHLADWRECEARKRNVPKTRIIKDEILLAIASLGPETEAAVIKIRGFARSSQHFASPILECLAFADREDKSLWPSPPKRRGLLPPKATVELLHVLLKHCAESAQVAARLIASSDDISLIALGQTNNVKAMAGWRYQIFGQSAERLSKGEIALGVKDGAITIIENHPD